MGCKKVCEARDVMLEASFEASGDKLSDFQHRAQELEFTKETVGDLASTVYKAENTLIASR